MTDAHTYHRKRKKYRLASLLLHTSLLIYLSLMSGEPLLGMVKALALQDFWQRGLFLVLFYLLAQFLLWPIRYLSNWKLEKDFGMLKQNFAGWLKDTFITHALGILFFTASALVFFSVLRAWPEQWWWLLAIIAFAFSAFTSTVFPVLILPLFYQCVPLNEPNLVPRLQKTLEICGLPKLPLFEIRMGKKTVRANAMLTGFGKTRRALLSDTLLTQYEPTEIEMVLAHEAGHDRRRHLMRSLIFEAGTASISFYVLFRFSQGVDLLSLEFFPTLVLAVHLAGLTLLPLANSLSRLHETEADNFALERYPDIAVFSSLMEKLAQNNLSDPSPSGLEEFFLYTHPSKKNRIAHARNILRMRLAN